MRCPECNQRNSVAAKTCTACGRKFERKSNPIVLIAIIAVVVLGVTVWAVAAAVVPKFTDPGQGLTRAAKRVAMGPSSPEDAQLIKSDFDKAVIEFLKSFGSEPTPELTQRLQKELNSNAFEVHVFDLPKAIKVVEIDTVLQASPYLLMKSGRGTKVYPLNGIEVFDNAQVISDVAPVLVLLGHSSGQGAHRPQLKVFGLLPDDVVDRSDKTVPPIKGEGPATFAKNNKDVQADISLLSLGLADKLFKPVTQLPAPDETLHFQMLWKDGHYTVQPDFGKGPLAALYAVAYSMRNPDQAKNFDQYLGAEGQALVRQYKLGKTQAGPDYVIAKNGSGTTGSRRHPQQTSSYTIAGTNGTFALTLSPSETCWRVVHGEQTSKVAEKLAQQQVDQQQKVTEASNEKKITTKSAEDVILQAKTPSTTTTQETPPPASTVTPVDSTSKVIERKTREATEAIKTPKETPKQVEAAVPPTQNTPPAQTTSNSHEKPAVPADETFEGDTISAPEHIKVRRGPSTGYRTVTEVQTGARLEIIGKKDGWYKVRTNGREGYVFGGLVDSHKSDAYTTATVTKSKAVRDEHDNSVHTPQPGDKMVVLSGLKNDKYRVKLPNGKTGYVDRDAVNVKTEEPQLVP